MSHAATRSPRLLVLLAALCACLALTATWCLGADTTPSCRSQLRDGDEFWQLSTRHLCGCPSPELAASIAVHQRLDADGRSAWVARSLAELFHADSERATVFYVHGNRVTADDATTNGWRLYQTLVADDSPPVRIVVWSWPSERVRGPLRDVRSKAARTEDEAYYFGWTLRQFESRQRVGVFGYSYGARVVTGGLHMAAGGELYGQTLAAGGSVAATATTPAGAKPETPEERSPSDTPPDAAQVSTRFGVTLVAAAEHNHWIMPSSLHGRALEPVDQLFNLYNSCDPVLARYRMIDRCERPTALGYAGISSESLGAASGKLEQRDAASTVGSTHDESVYLHYGVTPDELRRHLLPPTAATK